MNTDKHAKRRGTVNGEDALLAFPTCMWTEDPTPTEERFARIPKDHLIVETLTDYLGTVDPQGTQHPLIWEPLPDNARVTITVQA